MLRRVLVDAPASHPSRPWALIEDVLSAACPDPRAALRQERAALGLATGPWSPPLTRGERARCESLSALRLAALPNVAVLDNPVADAWMRVLDRAQPATPIIVRVSLREATPCEALATLASWSSRVGGHAVELRWGDEAPDARELLPWVCALRLSAPVADADGELALSAVGLAPLPDPTRAAFGAYAWDAALRGAVACLELAPGDVELSMLAGLSAHYLAPHDKRVSTWATGQFAAALAGSADDRVTAHARYRLAVHAARHGGDATLHADAAIEAARGVTARDGGAYVLAWAHNARAFAAWRAGDPSRAAQELDLAVAAFEGLDVEFAESVAPAVERTWSHLRANLSRAQGMIHG